MNTHDRCLGNDCGATTSQARGGWKRPFASGGRRAGTTRKRDHRSNLPKFDFVNRDGGSWDSAPPRGAAALDDPATHGLCSLLALLCCVAAVRFESLAAWAGKVVSALRAAASYGVGIATVLRSKVATTTCIAARPGGAWPKPIVTPSAREALRPFLAYASGYDGATSLLGRVARTVGAVLLALTLAMVSAGSRAGTVNIALSPVGDAGNVADSRTGFGAVAYPYQIGTYDVTMAQYTGFLNAVAASDPYGLYQTQMATATPTYGILRTSTSAGYSYALRSTGSANVPVTYVDWGDAARFVNWAQNGEPTGLGEAAGSTETDTYALNGSTGSAALMAVTRSTTATWVLPNADEWNKAGYYVGGSTNAGYWNYPTQNNSDPSNVLSATGTNNANYDGATLTDPVGWLTPVGAFAASPGPYATFDMGGDVYQWTETASLVPYNTGRYFVGGSYGSTVTTLYIGGGGSPPPTTSGANLGFRVASVPEPGAAAILFFASLLALIWGVFSVLRSPGAGNSSSYAFLRSRRLCGEVLEPRRLLNGTVAQYDTTSDLPSTAWEQRKWIDVTHGNVEAIWATLPRRSPCALSAFPPGERTISQRSKLLRALVQARLISNRIVRFREAVCRLRRPVKR